MFWKIVFAPLLVLILTACNAPAETPRCEVGEPTDLSVFTDYATALAEAQRTGKPMLLYFTGYADVNSRVFEDYILTDICVHQKIYDDFIFLQLLVDDINTGEAALDLQQRFMEEAFQPAWAVLDGQERLFQLFQARQLDLSGLRNSVGLKSDESHSRSETEADKFLHFLDQALYAVQQMDTLALANPTLAADQAEGLSYFEDDFFEVNFAFEKKSETSGDFTVTFLNPQGARLLAPEQESENVITMELTLEKSSAYETDGKLQFPKPTRVMDELLEEVIMYYTEDKTVLRQPLRVKSPTPFSIKGELVFSWMNANAIYAPEVVRFEVVVN